MFNFDDTFHLYCLLESTSIYFNDWKRVRLLEKEKRDEQSQKIGQLALNATRVLVHILLALFVLTSGLVSKGTILYITNQAGYFEKVILT